MRPEDALAHLPASARRVAYRVAFRILQLWGRVRRPQTNGVKCVLRHEGRILFIRHTYGDRALWELPGGGVHRDEDPQAAARREAVEELGVDLQWRPLGAVELHHHGVTALSVFEADAVTDVVTIDPGELAEARWAAPETPPRPLSQSTAAILKLL